MPLLNSAGLLADLWHRIDAEAPIPPGRAVILPYARLAADGETVLAAGQWLGVSIANDADLGVLAPWLRRLSMVAIAFPGFADGRGFSLARQLRLRGFRGELRASGRLIADQFAFALAAGFDTVEIDDALLARQPIADWLEAASAISLSYQRDYGGPPNILEARRAARNRAARARAVETEPAK